MKKTSRILAAVLSLIMLLGALALPSFAASPAQVKSLRVTEADDDELELRWGKVNGADGYQVYLKKGNGNFKKVLTTKKTSADIENLLSAQTYTIKVRAFDKTNSKTTYGSFSKAVTTSTEPDEVQNLTVKAVSKSKATLSWNAVRGAEGYRVYKFNASTKKWVRVAELSKTTLSVSAKSGDKFKVRAFSKVSGKYYFGDYSSVATVGLDIISYAKAKSIAVKKAGVSAETIREYSAELDKEHGKYVYEIEFTSGKYEYEIEINAKTGKVIAFEKDYR